MQGCCSSRLSYDLAHLVERVHTLTAVIYLLLVYSYDDYAVCTTYYNIMSGVHRRTLFGVVFCLVLCSLLTQLFK